MVQEQYQTFNCLRGVSVHGEREAQGKSVFGREGGRGIGVGVWERGMGTWVSKRRRLHSKV